jgi:exopolysaccharide biosynthesis predicted pyruvyltransferase EpsI
MYALLESVSSFRRAFIGHYPTIEEAIAAIPAPVVHWEADTANDAADAFAANGALYVVEREAR